MLFPIAYFPSILYLKTWCQYSGNAVIDLHEHWIKQSIRNRCEILGSSGVQSLVIPIRHEKGKQGIEHIRVDDSKKWRKSHWKSIITAYGNSSYFEHYALEIEGCIFLESELLYEINLRILEIFTSLWGLPESWNVSKHFSPYTENDLRLYNWLDKNYDHESYSQVFQERKNFLNNASSLDLLCCEGPLGRRVILN